MARADVDLPVVGDAVRLRGRGKTGILRHVNDVNQWCRVDWTNDDGPKICHIRELERTSD